MDTKNVTPRFDEKRLARVGARMRQNIEAGRYHGAALVAARRGEVVAEVVEGFADRQW